MNTPHKHAEVIKAWADGAEIQRRAHAWASWIRVPEPCWQADCEYRVKPKPKPDVVRFAVCATYVGVSTLEVAQDLIKRHASFSGIVKFVIDGETNKVKSAEVVS